MASKNTEERMMLFEDCCGTATLWLNESEKYTSKGAVRFRGKFQEANTVNKNRRMYPFEVLDSNVERLQEAIENRQLVGELDHPTDSILHFENCSHLISKLWWEGHTLMGEAEVLPTPAGEILRKLIESKVRIGISSRGVGNGQSNNEGVLVIGESFRLITFDAVADPSTSGAFQEPVSRNETCVVRDVKTVKAKNVVSNNYKSSKPYVEHTKEKINAKAVISYLNLMFDLKTESLQ